MHWSMQGSICKPAKPLRIKSIPASGRPIETDPLCGSQGKGCEMLVLTNEQAGLIVITSDSHRALVVVDSSCGVGIMYEVVWELLWAVKPYVIPILVSTYAIIAALSAYKTISEVMPIAKRDALGRDATVESTQGIKEKLCLHL